MSLLTRTRPQVPAPVLDRIAPWRRVLTAAGYGAVGALALVLLLAVPAIAAWVADAQSPDSWIGALAVAPVLWALAHHGSVGVPGEEVAVTMPLLGLTALAVAFAAGAARAALMSVEEDAPSDDGEEKWWFVPSAYVGGYALTGFIVTLLAWLGAARPNPIFVLPGAAVVAALGLILALVRLGRTGEYPWAGEVLDRITTLIPVQVMRALRPALLGAAALVAVGALVVLVAVVTSWSRVSEISGELQPGWVGGGALVLGHLAALPNAAVWTAGWLSGASVYVGPVTIGHAAVEPGVLPMIPAFGALPEAGATPAWAPATPLVLLSVGGFVGWLVLRNLTSLASLQMKAQTAAVAGASAGGVVVVLGFLGAMGVSGGTMAYVGPSWVTLLLVPLEVAIGAVVAASVLHVVRTRK